MQTYDKIGESIAGFGGPDWTKSNSVGQNDGNFGPSIDRSKVRGSPVVPGSAKVLVEEGEYAMYTMTILKGQYKAGIVADDVFTPGNCNHNILVAFFSSKNVG
ncbi:hypothetical protein EON65_06665 [archaeon]|nr:MAG: hypothetical protein EON65_06665 [archaeon]